MRIMAKKIGNRNDPTKGAIILYQSPDGKAALDVRLDRETVWLNLNQMAGLFERDKSVISRHLGNVFKNGELERKSVFAFFATTASDGKTYKVEYFNLDAIISVGYRVNSKRGTQFRIWATNVLREHLVRGFTLNEKRLLEQETVWLTQQMMAELFQTTKQNIGQHLKNIFSDGELPENSVVKKFFTTAADGKRYETNFYNLDAIISVGYRVRNGSPLNRGQFYLISSVTPTLHTF
ncbi:hypothetical protein PITCH_A140083 [uncultured Desulfobacterium sp.]|uniref:Uncharacterized protein n=1 Tax=uncultured Desulfobacterium sp. TaxID=201089 RepID=A0A445MT35_9BACT|nr:hypothetical protein PITCH_A140083 [uncultured Desulfobacterium sp.]